MTPRAKIVSMSSMQSTSGVPPAPTGAHLRFGGRLVEQLGAQMYPSATATVAELISNAWDADARNVWITMPFGDWENGEIVVIDDGNGMDEAEAREAYLVVGRNRRRGGHQRSEGGRLLHGRKGIGKLAAFGTARYLELKTRREGEPPVAFRLDYEDIRQREPDDPYQVADTTDESPIANPETGDELPHGTRIRLTDLRMKRRLNEDSFLRSMSRRFALDKAEMRVVINGKELQRFHIDLEFQFPRDAQPPELIGQEGEWGLEELSNGKPVKWWIGFTPKPLRGEAQQGISVLARGKLAQRPFKFERYQGVTGQLGQEYLVGEVMADWLDDPDALDAPDYIQSNRDQLQLEDDDLDPLVQWGRRRLAWALAQRNGLRLARVAARFEASEPLRELLTPLAKPERAAMTDVAVSLSQLADIDDDGLVQVMQRVVDAKAENVIRRSLDEAQLHVSASGDEWQVIRELAPVDARTTAATVESRVLLFGRLLEEDLRPGNLQGWIDALLLTPWLIGPEWDTYEVTTGGGALDGTALLLALPLEPAPARSVGAVAVIDPAAATDVTERHLSAVAEATRSAAEALRSDVDADEARSIVISERLPDGFAGQRQGVLTWHEAISASAALHGGWLAALRARASQNGKEN